MSRATVTTSWDDGHVLDLRLAGLLRQYGLRGTFYIAPQNHELAPANRLTEAQIRSLAEHFEIGAHTVTHPRLPRVTQQQAAGEIGRSKTVLEAIIGRAVTSFCYPGGEYRPGHVGQVRDSGYTYARTVERFHFAPAKHPLTAPTSVHAYRHWSDLPRIVAFARFHPYRTLRYLLNWDDLAMAMFDRTAGRGGLFHLWGHSWEIDQRGDWNRLERVLRHISGHPAVIYATNGELA